MAGSPPVVGSAATREAADSMSGEIARYLGDIGTGNLNWSSWRGVGGLELEDKDKDGKGAPTSLMAELIWSVFNPIRIRT
jgi:hypothetical protein